MSDPVRVIVGDCLEVMRGMDAESVDAIVTDPPYGLSFMGKHWDHGVPGVDFWVEALRVAKPGAHLLAFGGTRTYHRLACAIEDAGWEVRDCIAWVYGSGFPKSLDVSKAIDKRGGASVAWFGPWLRKWRQDNGVTQKQIAELFPSKTGGLTGCVANWELGLSMPTPEQFNLVRDTFNLPFCSIEEAERETVAKQRGTYLAVAPGQDNDRGATVLDITAPATDLARQWSGWGTALKPAFEPIIVARKPLIGTVAENVTAHGTGAMNVDGCRVEGVPPSVPQPQFNSPTGRTYGMKTGEGRNGYMSQAPGRWPANLIHDGSDEVVALFPRDAGAQARVKGTEASASTANTYGNFKRARSDRTGEASAGSANDGAVGFAMKPGMRTHDKGSAARFFYCAKASKSERWDYLSCDCEAPIFPAWESEGRSRSARTVYTSPARDTCAGSSTADSSSLTLPLGNAFTDACPEDTKSITSTMTSRTTASKTCGSSVPPSTSAFIPGASCAATNGGSRAEYAASSSPSTRGIGTSPERDGPSMGVAVPATSLRSSETSNCGNCGKPFRRVGHPTVKPTTLMRYLCRLVTPPGGIVLDPFAGSGSTGKGAVLEGFNFIGIELDAEYAEIARARIGNATPADKGLFA